MAKIFPLLLLVNFLNFSLPVHGANVLAVLPSVWQSHYLFGRRLLSQLVEQQNHSVTLISPHAANGDGEAAVPNIREIRIEGLMDNWLEMGLSFDMEEIRQKSVMERFTRLIYAGTTNVDLLLDDAQVKKLLRSDERFDLFVVDLFLSDSLLGLSHYYEIPTVVISPTGANTWLNQMLGNPQSSALDPSNFLPYSERMNIWERSVNTLMGWFEMLTYNFFHMISQQTVYEKHFEPLCQHNLPHLRELTKNLSLVLINSHPIVQYPRAYLPNMLEIAGAHLHNAEPLKLPTHLNVFIEAAPKGVVYVSFGADLKTADLPREKLLAFLDVFAQLTEMHFLLKWELEEFHDDLPPNVMINEWFPQETILAHTNVKVFISSCGLMSVVESINGNTPILAIPIYPEQEVAAKRLNTQGVSLTIPYDLIAYDAVLQGIRELAANSSYTQNMQHLRHALNSSYVTPMTKSLHYIDLILNLKGTESGRSGGGSFLKSHARHLNFLRSELVDVLAIITLGLLGILAVPFLVTCCILRKSYHSQAANANPANYRVTLQCSGRRANAIGGGASGDGSFQRRRRISTTLSSSSSSTSSSGSPEAVSGKNKRETLARNSQSSQQSD